MSDAPRPPVAIRIVRPYETLDHFLSHELETVAKTSVLLIGAHARPVGVILRFEVALASGETILRGEGRVLGHKEGAFRGQPALSLRFTRLDRKSKALVDHAAMLREARARGDDPASIPPPPVVPDSEPQLASARMIPAPASEDTPSGRAPSRPPTSRTSAPPPSGRTSAPPPSGRTSAPPPSGRPLARTSAPPPAATVPPEPEEGTLGAAVAAFASDGADEVVADATVPPTGAAAAELAATDPPEALVPTVEAPSVAPTATKTEAAPAPATSLAPREPSAAPPPPPASSGRRFGPHEAPTAQADRTPVLAQEAPTATRGRTLERPQDRDGLLARLRDRAAALPAERVAEILAKR